jgi:hypothetical protein
MVIDDADKSPCYLAAISIGRTALLAADRVGHGVALM